MYLQMKIDDCWTYTFREMELNAKSNQKLDRQDKILIPPLHSGRGIKTKNKYLR